MGGVFSRSGRLRTPADGLFSYCVTPVDDDRMTGNDPAVTAT
jgi:hypothetical protein